MLAGSALGSCPAVRAAAERPIHQAARPVGGATGSSCSKSRSTEGASATRSTFAAPHPPTSPTPATVWPASSSRRAHSRHAFRSRPKQFRSPARSRSVSGMPTAETGSPRRSAASAALRSARPTRPVLAYEVSTWASSIALVTSRSAPTSGRSAGCPGSCFHPATGSSPRPETGESTTPKTLPGCWGSRPPRRSQPTSRRVFQATSGRVHSGRVRYGNRALRSSCAGAMARS